MIVIYMTDKKKISISYWSKKQKKNIIKTKTINKNTTEEQARQFLKEWKEKQLLNENNEKIEEPTENIKDEPKEEPQEEEPQEEEIKEVIIETNKEPKSPLVNYEPLLMDIPDLNKTGCSLCVYGASRTGKTTQIYKIYKKYYYDKDTIAFLISPNEHVELYDDFKKDGVIVFDFWNDQLINDLHIIQKKTKNKYKFVVMVDDVIDQKSSEQLQKCFLTLRNSKISVIINLQGITLLNKQSRHNANNLIIRKWNNDLEREDTIKYFLNSFEPFYSMNNMREKVKLLKDACGMYNYIYLDALHNNLTFHDK